METSLKISEKLVEETSSVIIEANVLVVTDNQTNKFASDYLKNLKSIQKRIEDEFDPAIAQAHQLHKSLTDQRKRYLAPLEHAEQAIKRKIADFLAIEEQRRQEEQRKAQAIAEAAERKRREELEEQARRHEAAGRTEKAEERRQMAEETFVPAPIVESKIEQQKGISTVQVWKFEIVDESKLPSEYTMPDEAAIGKVVRALKDKANIPGVRVFFTNEIRARV